MFYFSYVSLEKTQLIAPLCPPEENKQVLNSVSQRGHCIKNVVFH